MTPAGRYQLVVWAGDEPDVHPLPAHGAVAIGRGADNDIRIEHPSVSRRHVRLHVDRPMRLEDLGATNGTFVRSRRPAPAGDSTHPVERIAGRTIDVARGDAMILGSVLAVVRNAPGTTTTGSGTSPVPDLEGGIVVRDPAMRALYDQARLAARSLISVLVLGETGVGKEVLACAIHQSSPRKDRPFVAINCAALTESLLESELFGHEKGAFTGALATRQGLFEAGDGGTVFLDEIGEMPLGTQAKILRVLEERAVTRVGGRAPRRVDVRFIAATNRDLETDVERGAFRRDLFFRLNGITLAIPPLSTRRDEIGPLAHQFAVRAYQEMGRSERPTVSPEALGVLCKYSWPGNIRELRNAIERAAVLCPGRVIGPEHLSSKIIEGAARAPEPGASPAPAGSPALPPSPPGAREAPPAAADPSDHRIKLDRDEERRRILAVLDQCAGNQTQAAARLGISRRTLISRIEEYGLPRPRKKTSA